MRAHLRSGEAGSALIEFALCLPPLALMIAGIFIFGIAIVNYGRLTNAVKSAAIHLAISRGTTLDPCAVASSALTTAAPKLRSANITYSFVLNGASYSGTTCASPSTTSGAAGHLVRGRDAIVIARYPCNPTSPSADNSPGCVLTAKASEVVR